MELSQLPAIYIEIEQPGDKGDFFVNVYDSQNKQKILTSKLKENISYLEYAYTSRLLEGGGLGIRTRDEKLAERQKQERHEDIVRYGQRLYSDLFGKGNTLKKYISQQAHFQNGARLILRLHSTASELWNIPWEYIHDGEDFVGIQPEYPIMRSLLDTRLERNDVDWRTFPMPLRVLFVISNPQDAPPLNVDAEIAMMRDAVQDAEEQGLLEMDFIEDGTLENLEEALKSKQYHILHYSGHGSISPQGSFLVMENDSGFVRPVFLNQILPILEKSDLRFVFLSACKTGNIAETEASSGIATGLLTKIPAVLAMQYAIRDNRASELSAAFYSGIAQGFTLEEATHYARLALNKSDADLSDWGVPSLYLHKPNLRLLDPNSAARTVENNQFDLTALPESKPFVGRHHERRLLRTAINNPEMPMAYIWGLAGMGKSTLVKHVLARPGHRDTIADVLVLLCDKSSVQETMEQIVGWLKQHFPETQQILDAKAPILKRLQLASEQIKDKRLVIVFDRFDALMNPQENRQWDLNHPKLAELMYFFATANWSILSIFTSRSRWAYLANLAEDKYTEIHLDSLVLQDVIFLMQQLEALKGIDVKVINKFFREVGGHPLTLKLTNDYIRNNPEKTDLDSPEFTKKLTTMWHKGFMGKLITSLRPDEQEALRILSIHRDNFNPEHVQFLLKLGEMSEAEQMIAGWEALSLAYFIDKDTENLPWYRMPNLVQTYISNIISEEDKPRYHARVAAVVRRSLYNAAKARYDNYGGAEVIPDEPFESVLAHIRFAIRTAPAPVLNRYLDLIYTWYTHFRDAKQIDEAIEVAHALMVLIDMFYIRELRDEILEWLLENTPENSVQRIETRYWEAVVAQDDERFDEARQILLEVLRESQQRKADNVNDIKARSLSLAAAIDRSLGNYRDAILKWESVLAQYTREQNFVGAARIFLYIGEMAYFQPDRRTATQNIDSGLKILSRAERIDIDGRVYGRLLLYRGHLYRKTKNDHGALQCYREVFKIGNQSGDAYLIGKGLENMGYIYGLLRQYDSAAQYLLQSIHIYENINDMTSMITALARLAMIYDYKGNQSDAIVFAERAHRLATEYAPSSLSQIETVTRRFKRRKLIGF